MSDLMMEELFSILTNQLKKKIGNELKDIILYGSYARGTYDVESDIDIAVIINTSRENMRNYDNDIVQLMSELLDQYGIVVNICDIPHEEYLYWKDTVPFYRNIDKEGKRLIA